MLENIKSCQLSYKTLDFYDGFDNFGQFPFLLT